jgi:hypothetical protein
MRVQACIRAIAEIPPTHLCCESVRRELARDEGKVLDVNPRCTMVIHKTCADCRTAHSILSMELIGGFRGYEWIPIEFVDLDEGIGQ